MNLVSERLTFTLLSESEFSNYVSYYTHEEVMKYITGKALTEMEAKDRFARALETNQANADMGWFIAKSKEDGAFVGVAKLVMIGDSAAEVGYGTFPAYWNKKYATEILRCLMLHARTLPSVLQLIATVRPDNEPSRRVLIKQGFTLDHTEEEDGRPVEHFRFILRVPTQFLNT